MLDFRLLLDSRCLLGESPVWDDRRKCLFFVDIEKPAIHAVDLDGMNSRSWIMPMKVGSIGLGESGRIVVALSRSIAVLVPETGALEHLTDLPEEPESNRLNDGKVGPDGSFWVGSMDDRLDKEAVGSLYKINGKGQATRIIACGHKVSNGLAWTPDGRTMFHSDSRGPWIDRYEFNSATGELSQQTRIASLDEKMGRPDGGACDAEGNYWSAGVSAGCLNRFSRDGTLLQSYSVPAPAPTMPCFCGPDLKTLVITSLTRPAAARGDDLRPEGGLYIALSPVAGARVERWRDN